MSGRTRDEVLTRLQERTAEVRHWRSRVAEFGELDSLTKMHYAQERANELAWMLEGFTDVAVQTED